MALLPQPTLEERINDLIEQQTIKEYPRPYIGYSELGGPCKRAIWYSFRWVKLFEKTPRLDRLFKRGDAEEPIIIADLKQIGFAVHSEQQEIHGFAGHVLGHIDALAHKADLLNSELPILLEFKTANDKRFKLFKKNGIKETAPHYYYQMQSYMGKLELEKGLFVLTNKNDEERWLKIVDFDIDAYEQMEHRAFEILTTDVPPQRIGNRTWHECKLCQFHAICHENDKILKSCRTCQHGTIQDEGIWRCGLTQMKLSLEDQKKACDRYKTLEEIRN